MSAMPSVSSIALQILRQPDPLSPSSARIAPVVDLVATANGLVGPDDGSPSTQARAKITEALFSPNSLDVNKMKINLMERLGQEFGISMDDFDSRFAFGVAVKRAVDAIKRDHGAAALIEIERRLGLDELGISLDTLVNAIIEPGGHGAEKLDAALREKAGESLKDEGRPDPRAILADEIGLYRF